jgi:hypothetical protein
MKRDPVTEIAEKIDALDEDRRNAIDDAREASHYGWPRVKQHEADALRLSREIDALRELMAQEIIVITVRHATVLDQPMAVGRVYRLKKTP